ncbi:hypothetical protein INR49_006984 [Caranx melampygus]|nr:hypothetical protein INR49_006984 [Caranx melampygus]
MSDDEEGGSPSLHVHIRSCDERYFPTVYQCSSSSSALPPQEAGSHPHMGCAVMSLSIIQLIMAALRPASESSRCMCVPGHRPSDAAIVSISADVLAAVDPAE